MSIEQRISLDVCKKDTNIIDCFFKFLERDFNRLRKNFEKVKVIEETYCETKRYSISKNEIKQYFDKFKYCVEEFSDKTYDDIVLRICYERRKKSILLSACLVKVVNYKIVDTLDYYTLSFSFV